MKLTGLLSITFACLLFACPIVRAAMPAVPTAWRFATDARDVGRKQKWFAPSFDDSSHFSSWFTIFLPRKGDDFITEIILLNEWGVDGFDSGDFRVTSNDGLSGFQFDDIICCD